jgi:GT2 family glycosyltransferase
VSDGPVLVTAIVIAFGREDLLFECLQSLDAALERVNGKTELVVVLNRISAEGRKRLAGLSRPCILVEPETNIGFAGGMAVGIARSRGRWVATFNDDCVLDPEAVVELLGAGRSRSDVGSVAAQVRFAGRPDVINSAGIDVDVFGVARERLLGMHVEWADRPVDVFGASGCAALYRRRMLTEVGGFDPTFFAYLEDADLAWRAQMFGWRCVYAPKAIVRHHHSMSLGHGSPEKLYLVGRNRVRMLAKNASSGLLRRNGLKMTMYDLLYVAHAAATKKSLAPAVGRMRGLVEWRRYRRVGTKRVDVDLAASAGLRAALRRDWLYAAVTDPPH